MSASGEAPPTFAVVVPTHRWSDSLEACLAGIARLDPAPDQVLVVLDGCPMPERPVAPALSIPLQIVRMPENRGPAAARNCGAEVAETSHLVFLDSDVVPSPDLLARLATHLEPSLDGDEPPAAVIGSYDDRPADRRIASTYRNLLHHWTHQTGNREAFTFWGACGMVSRAAFDDVGGFDESYRRPSIEDIELGFRLRGAGHRIVLDPSIQIRHLKQWTVGSILVTDLRDRAIPWTRLLMRAGGDLPDDLNLRLDQRLSALLALLGLSAPLIVLGLHLAGLGTAWDWSGALVVSALSVAGLLALNRDFYGFLRRRRGTAFLLGALPLHWLYFLVGGVGFVWGMLAEWRTTGSVRVRALRGALGIDAPEPVARDDGQRHEAAVDVTLCPPAVDQNVSDSVVG